MPPLRDDEAWLQVETNSRYQDTKVFVVFRDGRRHQLHGIKRVDLSVGRHEVATGVIHCDLACEMTGHKEN